MPGDLHDSKGVEINGEYFWLVIRRFYTEGAYWASFHGLGTEHEGLTPLDAEKAAIADLKLHWEEYKILWEVP